MVKVSLVIANRHSSGAVPIFELCKAPNKKKETAYMQTEGGVRRSINPVHPKNDPATVRVSQTHPFFRLDETCQHLPANNITEMQSYDP
ncbi:hypothetical protein EYC80_002218 [Monilinia laxa]|uniref:Uncharacterized protein n=1 Tax=Monilinia laxa TaxID=61186 RepID=A0A5N6K3B5_MONLA|nr:hypothetical protein EYC80_002218 [Monilinia laxa]